MQLSEQQIIALAPDEASVKAGRGLASSSKWVTKGANEQALWGECQGSGSKPYQTQVDLSTVAFKCSCPSRKFPCKHGLGLMLLYAMQPQLFKDAQMPDWVSDWISRRSEKQEKKAEKSEKPVDEAAQAKRREARAQKVTDGIEELLTWLKDIVRGGILNMPEKPASFWDNMARRMIDSQAPGLAAMVKSLAATSFWNEGWQSVFMDRLAQLYMVAAGYGNQGGIDELMLADLRSAIGFTVGREELMQGEGIKDMWLVLARETSDDGQLTTELNWLTGLETGRIALVLQFYVRGQFGQLSLTPGMYLDAEIAFYPSSVPLRAIIKESRVIGDASNTKIKGFEDWHSVASYQTELNSRLPFRPDAPVIVEQLRPVPLQKDWWLQDCNGSICRIAGDAKQLWKLLAITGGEPSTLAVVGRENSYRPIGIWCNQKYTTI